MRIAILGAGAGGAAASVELTEAGNDAVLWSRSPATIAPFEAQGGVRYDGVLGHGLLRPAGMTCRLAEALEGAGAALVVLPTFLHGDIARALAEADWPSDRPVILNPGHTGGALEFASAYAESGRAVPPLAEFSTLTYVARLLTPGCVTVTGTARRLRAAALPGGAAALDLATRLFPAAEDVADVLNSGLANVNAVLHPPGAILAAAWVEASGGDFTFYVEGLTEGTARTMRALDAERRALALAFGHDLPNLVAEMQRIGTVEPDFADNEDFRSAIAGGEANRRIRAPASFAHRYYREDFGHGLLPMLELADIAGVAMPVARALLTLAETATGTDTRLSGRTRARMGLAGLGRDEVIAKVRRP